MWKRATFHLIEVAVVNSYILYKLSNQTGCHRALNEYVAELRRDLVERGGHLACQSQLSVASPIQLID